MPPHATPSIQSPGAVTSMCGPELLPPPQQNGTARSSSWFVAPTAIVADAAAEALIGTRLEPEALDAAATRASEAGNPIDDKRGPAWYRRRLAGVLTRRAAQRAAERARRRSLELV